VILGNETSRRRSGQSVLRTQQAVSLSTRHEFAPVAPKQNGCALTFYNQRVDVAAGLVGRVSEVAHPIGEVP
jgi:hypothetical protein